MFLLWTCLLAVSWHSQAAPNIPWKSWTFCKKSDLNKAQCLIKAMNSVAKDLLSGNAYFALNPLEPLHIAEMIIDQDKSNSPVAVKLILKETDISGLRFWDVKDMKTDWEKGEIWGKVDFKGPVVVTGDYKIEGKVLLLPITGEGKFNMTLDAIQSELNFKGKTVEDKGFKYYNTETLELDIKPKKMYVNFENLFNGNKDLGDNMNRFLNENWKEIFREMKINLTKVLAEAFRQISNKVFAKIPLSELNPE